MKNSEQLLHDGRIYSLYVLQHRAIPAASDGLKPAARRVLWTGRDGKKYKTAVLAGATMPIHPHASPDGTIDTLTGPYNNNIPLFKGYGAFGTMLNPTAYGASRYTSVEVSAFTKDVVFKDIEIIPMIENYDSTLMEPAHFLPLIPMAVLNPNEGIAIGFACNILPRKLKDIITGQINYLNGKEVDDSAPSFLPLDNTATKLVAKDLSFRWMFTGTLERINTYSVKITKLPYGLSHENFTERLIKLIEEDKIVDYVDDSKDIIDMTIKFRRGELVNLTDEQIIKTLGLTNNHTENMNVLDYSGTKIWSTNYVELIKSFTDWRLTFYSQRYARLVSLLDKDISKYNDILLSIKKNLNKIIKDIANKQELLEVLAEMGIVDVEYVASLPIYRFTAEEKEKTEKLLTDALALRDNYMGIINSGIKQRDIYIKELKDVLNKYA